MKYVLLIYFTIFPFKINHFCFRIWAVGYGQKGEFGNLKENLTRQEKVTENRDKNRIYAKAHILFFCCS